MPTNVAFKLQLNYANRADCFLADHYSQVETMGYKIKVYETATGKRPFDKWLNDLTDKKTQIAVDLRPKNIFRILKNWETNHGYKKKY